METLQQIYERVCVKPGYFCDKNTVHSYLDVYSELLSPYRSTAKRVLEIGTYDGGSLLLFEAYFHNAKVTSIDVSDQPLGKVDLRPMIEERVWKDVGDRKYLARVHDIRIFDATDKARVDFEFERLKFDVIVDDAAHALEQQIKLWENFKPYLAPGASYIIEDIADCDRDRPAFEALGMTVLDRRQIKNRFDDVIAYIKMP